MAENGGGGGGAELPPHLFLAEPQWESLPGGRVRCVQTGHEMPVKDQAGYMCTKKCRSALFEAALLKRTPPLNYFEQSPVVKDKIICKLTGVVLNKKEDAVWKHMLGKKFEQKLEEKEAEKGITRPDVEMAENSSEKPSSANNVELVNSSKKEKKGRRKKQEEAEMDEQVDEKKEEDQEGAKSDGSDFWVPPPGNRWDFDTGDNNRWTLTPKIALVAPQNNGHAQAAALEDGPDFDNGDTEMCDGEEDLDDSASSDDETAKISIKRMPTANVPKSQKKRRKRQKGNSRIQNGV